MCSKVARRSSHTRSSPPGSCQERTAAQAPRRLRLERDTVTNCEHLPLDRVPSPRVKWVEMRLQAGWKMTRPIPAEWLKVSVLVCACHLACHPVLTAELLPAWLVQRGFLPLERLLLLVRGRVVHGEHIPWSMFDR